MEGKIVLFSLGLSAATAVSLMIFVSTPVLIVIGLLWLGLLLFALMGGNFDGWTGIANIVIACLVITLVIFIPQASAKKPTMRRSPG